MGDGCTTLVSQVKRDKTQIAQQKGLEACLAYINTIGSSRWEQRIQYEYDMSTISHDESDAG